MGGRFTTRRKTLIRFRLPEFSLNKDIEWNVHVDDTTSHKTSPYDLIIGTDLLAKLGMIIDFNQKRMKWSETEVPMRPIAIIGQTCHRVYMYRYGQKAEEEVRAPTG